MLAGLPGAAAPGAKKLLWSDSPDPQPASWPAAADGATLTMHQQKKIFTGNSSSRSALSYMWKWQGTLNVVCCMFGDLRTARRMCGMENVVCSFSSAIRV